MSDNFLRFFLKKIFDLVASLALLLTLSFFLLKLLPGGPFDEDAALNPLVKEQLAKQWRLHESALTQSYFYVTSMLKGDLGVSMVHPDLHVGEVIQQGLANTLTLNLVALGFAIGGALAIAVASLRYQGGWFESAIDQAMIAMLSLPSLFWGPLVIYIFGFYFNLLPIAFLSSPLHYVLPVMTLSFRPLATLVRLLKNSLQENLSQDYVRTAKAKGLNDWGVLIHHVLRNSLIPFLSYVGPLIASLLSGSFLVEMLFAIPGLGTQFISSLNDRDYTVMVGLTLFYGALLIVTNSALDFVMRWADPRLKEGP